MSIDSPPSGDMGARPLVLLSNDDGVRARGLEALRAALADVADVVVCAPESNQSATSHSLTLHRILRLHELGAPGERVFGVDGTPADCVYVALHGNGRVLPRAPDLVVSGLNHGPNLGADVFYSGTVAAAREGALRGIPSLAVSGDVGVDLGPAARLAAKVAMELLAQTRARARTEPRAERQKGVLLNLNIPRGQGGRWAVKSTGLGERLYTEEVEFRVDPRGRDYLWIGGSSSVRHGLVHGSDTEAYDAGIASLTPLALDLCDEAQRSFASSIAGAVVP